MIKLYSQKGASPVWQRQWKSNLVGSWVKVKGPHLLVQVSSWSSDHSLFKKLHVSTNAKPQNSAGDSKHRKTHKSKAYFIIQIILTFDSNQYTPI